MIHYTYILRCCDDSYYVGLTRDARRRVSEHQAGKSKSTKYRLPVKLVFLSCFPNKQRAASFEQYLKSHSGRAFFSKRLV